MMTLAEVFERAVQLTTEERKELVKLLVDTLVEKPTSEQKRVDLPPLDLGGMQPGVELIRREEFYDDETIPDRE
ncbi:MAG: hypothetical protein SFZ02_07270 [bacterium]|nr:hypothetical protein [bacterium]